MEGSAWPAPSPLGLQSLTLLRRPQLALLPGRAGILALHDRHTPSSAIFWRAAFSSSSARRRLLFNSMMLSWACSHNVGEDVLVAEALWQLGR